MARKSKQPVPRPNDPSLKALPKLKGGYYRRVKDIPRALDEMRVTELPSVVQFLFYYFGCEKLALGIVGVDAKLASEDAYGGGKFVILPSLKKAASSLNISISFGELDFIFGKSKTSARELRHSLVHDLGPSNVKNVRTQCAAHIPVMLKFLGCIDELHEYQRKTF